MQGQKVTVCFSAKIEPLLLDVAAGTNTVVFGGVHSNTGNGYNRSNGEFTAPVAGHYMFYSNILPQFCGRTVETVLQLNGATRQLFIHTVNCTWEVVWLWFISTLGKRSVARQGPWEAQNFYCLSWFVVNWDYAYSKFIKVIYGGFSYMVSSYFHNLETLKFSKLIVLEHWINLRHELRCLHCDNRVYNKIIITSTFWILTL